MKKVWMKASIASMVAIVIVLAIMLILVANQTKRLVNGIIERESQTANNAFQMMLSNYEAEALQRAEMIAGSGDVINAVKNNNNEALVKALKNFSTGLDLITLCDAEGNVLARTHSDKTGDSVLSQEAISIALRTGKGISTIEPGTVIGLSTRGSAAIKDENGTIIGALTCGHDLSQSKYIDQVKRQNSCEATFFAEDVRMSTTLSDKNGQRVLGTKADSDIVKTVLNDKNVLTGRREVYGITYAAYYSPLIVNNRVVGMLFTGINIEDVVAQESNTIVFIVISAIMLFLAVALTALIIKTTNSKSYWYESILDSIPFPISVTDTDMKWTFINKPVEEMLKVKRESILGKHCSNWQAGICNTENCGIKCLNKGIPITTFGQANMEFQVNVNYLYDAHSKKIGHIEVVQDITEMVKTQRSQTELVEQIEDVSAAFVNASRQIADGSQSLAQGSTEQAAAVQQLSSSITEIAEKTKDNAEMANKAAKMASAIKDSAEKGSQQMMEMMDAVKEINRASQSISQVISVIDNIAFQTNILALNASVEAARAGQHGKGFAVVAEEVRNLASKSADAAKDTGSLIANSMQKAELGSRIAGETSSSLIEIVNGINESSQLVSEIAKASENQSASITEINKGIDQVAQVVQQNSATAEESAAASQELSGQSSILTELLTDFKNRQGNQNKSLPPRR